MDRFDRIVLGIMAGLVALITFVVALGDRVAVGVSGFFPEPGSAPPATAPIRVTFGTGVEAASTEGAFSIQPEVEGTFRWEGSTLVFTPSSPLLAGQTYTVTVGPGVVNKAGRRTSRPHNWSFTPRAPTVLYLGPPDASVRGLWAVPPEGGEPREVYAPEYGIFGFAPAPDGAQVAVTAYNADLTTDVWLIDTDGGNPRRVTDCAPGSCGNAAWSPDGALLAYERREQALTGSTGPSRVWLYDPATGETAPLFEDSQVLGFGPHWSPDGSRIAFFDGNIQSIRIVHLETGEVTLIPSQMGEVGTFSPDGRRLVYTDIRAVGRQYYPELWLAELGSGGGLAPLTKNAEEDQAPAWSPDGRWVAFARRRLDRREGWGSQLYLLDLETGELRQLTADPAYNNTGFAWDLWSQRILVQRFELGATYAQPALWVYDLESDQLMLLVEGAFGGEWLP